MVVHKVGQPGHLCGIFLFRIDGPVGDALKSELLPDHFLRQALDLLHCEEMAVLAEHDDPPGREELAHEGEKEMAEDKLQVEGGTDDRAEFEQRGKVESASLPGTLGFGWSRFSRLRHRDPAGQWLELPDRNLTRWTSFRLPASDLYSTLSIRERMRCMPRPPRRNWLKYFFMSGVLTDSGSKGFPLWMMTTSNRE